MSGMDRLGIIGFGTMGEAFATALRRTHPEVAITAFDVKPGRLAAAAPALGVTVARDPASVARESDLTLLCVKPQDIGALMAGLAAHAKGRRFVSILAGTRIQRLSEGLGTPYVARFMPNIAAVAGKALVGISFAPEADPAFKADCLSVAGAFGGSLEIPERLMAAMCGLSSSGLAYVFAFADAMALGGVAAGFDYPTALKVAAEALASAAAMLKAESVHPRELVSRVASPAGTTIQGLRALERGGFTAAVMEAVEAGARRAQEFEG
jgi:pyrroline-5-carboxylate reductase